MTDTAFINEEARRYSGEELNFSFGANWRKFLSALDESVVACATKSFVAMSRMPRLDEHEFFDLGCGSGLSSLVAIRLGAKRVVSVDIDPYSIDCVNALRTREDVGENRWTVKQGSALDEAFLASLGRFSYVHSWGVLHHTGAMWRALDNLLRFNAAADGWVHIALYNAHRTSNRWLRIKRLCNRSPHLAFPLIKSAYVTLLFARMLTRFQSPLRFVRDYRSTRGMSFFRDVDDWLGGLPYEFCTPGEVVDFLTDRQFTLRRLLTTQSCGCNEFLFHGEPTPH